MREDLELEPVNKEVVTEEHRGIKILIKLTVTDQEEK
jgi:hypothetical protein